MTQSHTTESAASVTHSANHPFGDYFARLFEYDRWANRCVLETMASLGDRLPQKPVDRLSHLLICQEMWIRRITGAGEPITDFFPSWPLAKTTSRAAEIFALMERFIADSSETDLFSEFEYTSGGGGRFRNRRADVLTQLSQHGCYHRGQIACDLNPLLPEPLTTDYIYYCRQG